MSNGDKTYLAKAAAQGKFNGQIATKTGPKTVPNQNQSSLDKAKYGSAGTVKNGN